MWVYILPFLLETYGTVIISPFYILTLLNLLIQGKTGLLEWKKKMLKFIILDIKHIRCIYTEKKMFSLIFKRQVLLSRSGFRSPFWSQASFSGHSGWRPWGYIIFLQQQWVLAIWIVFISFYPLSCTQASHRSRSSSLVHTCGRLRWEVIEATPKGTSTDKRK